MKTNDNVSAQYNARDEIPVTNSGYCLTSHSFQSVAVLCFHKIFKKSVASSVSRRLSEQLTKYSTQTLKKYRWKRRNNGQRIHHTSGHGERVKFNMYRPVIEWFLTTVSWPEALKQLAEHGVPAVRVSGRVTAVLHGCTSINVHFSCWSWHAAVKPPTS